jgi:endonuclease YncB( thermonuclease family)
MLENQIKQEELNAKIRKAKNDANTLAADRAINAKVAMSPSAQALQQSLQSGQLLGEDYLDATPEVISGARSAVGDMLTNSLNQDKVSALVPDKILAKLGATAPDAATAEAWRKDPTVFNNPALNGASAGAWEKFGSAGKVLAENSGTIRKEGEAVDTSAINKRVDTIFGLALAGGGSKTDIRNNAYALANQSGFTGPELTELTNRLKSSDIGFADPVAQVPNTTGGKTGTTPAANAIAGSIPIDNTGIDSGLNSAVLRNTYGNRPLPENINTLGDLFDNKQSEYFRGTDKELHTPTGPLQIVADTFARHGEKIYGKNWREQSLNDPKVHYDIGESIFKETGGNVDKLIGQWDALKKLPRSTVEKIAKGPWSEAAPIIAAAESGSNSGAARSMKQISNPDYTNSQVSNVTSRASRAIAQFSADPIVLNHSALSKSTLTADQVALDGVKTSVDYGSLNKDEMDLAARNIKRTIEYVQEQAGGNISPELAFAVAKQSFGDENFRILWLNSDLNLNTTKMNKIIKSLNDKGGIPDQANELTKMQGVFSKLEAANTNVATLQQDLIDAKRNNAGNPYSTVVSKAQAALDKALDIRTQITKEIEKNPVFQPKENVTVEQKLENTNNATNNNVADNFVKSRQGNVSKKLTESLSTTDPAQVKPVAAPISIPVKVDGKSGTGTTFALDSKTGQSIPVTPLKLDPNVKYLKPVTVVKADRSGGQKGVITYVGDGDGANIDVGGSTIKCRLDTFDAPETGGSPKKWPDQPYSREAENKLKSLIASGEVTVIVSKPADTSSPPSGKNNYGRSLCKIEVQGKNVDQEMLRSGAAWLRLEYATDEKLINLFNTAKTNKVGLFADPNAKAPWDYRNSFR